jgi:hypothetical protein
MFGGEGLSRNCTLVSQNTKHTHNLVTYYVFLFYFVNTQTSYSYYLNLLCILLFLQVNTTLKELHLQKYDMRDFGMTRLAENLMDNNSLTNLDLSW